LMVDILTPAKRSWNMSQIRSTNTKPEVFVLRLLRQLGYRFSTHGKGIPGTPDIVLRKQNTVIFVHGCFWHRHPGCKFAYTPKSRIEFWKNKFDENVARDKRNRLALSRLKWRIITLWECQTGHKRKAKLERKLRRRLLKLVVQGGL